MAIKKAVVKKATTKKATVKKATVKKATTKKAIAARRAAESAANDRAKAAAKAKGLPDRVITPSMKKARAANKDRPTTTAGRKAYQEAKYKDKKRPVSNLHSTKHKGELPVTDEEIAQALRKAGGLVSRAAQFLKRSTNAVNLRIKSTPWLQEVVHECRETFIDEAEGGLRSLVLDSDREAIKFTLRTIGKYRGYTYNELESENPLEDIEVVIGASDD